MRDRNYISLRREFLETGLTGAMIGLAECTDIIDQGTTTGTNDDETTVSSSEAESSQTALSITNFNLTKSDTKSFRFH